MRKLFSALLLVSIFIAPTAFAIEPSAGSDIVLKSVPELPGPNTKVTLTIESYATDLDRNVVSWIVNDKTVASGTGKNSITLTTGEVGSQTTVRVIVQKSNGTRSETSLVFRPAKIYMWWEADSYTPDLYSGKALHASESDLRVYAVPFLISKGVRIPSENLVYEWRRNGKVLQKESGYGKSSIKFTGSALYGQDSLRVRVNTTDDSVQAEGAVTIYTVDPDVRLYEIRPLSGINYTNSLKGIVGVLNRVILHAEPYFVARSSLQNGGVEMKWLSNGSPVGNARSLEIISGTETQNLQFEAATKGKMLQEGSAGLTITQTRK